jgi:hypothetical protein
MPNVNTANDFSPPKDTGNDYVDRAFVDLKKILIEINSRILDLEQPAVKRVFGAFQISSETVIEYAGTGNDRITLPPANSIKGTRSRIVYIINNSSGGITIAANGGDTINTFSSQGIGGRVFMIARSNGLNAWIGNV